MRGSRSPCRHCCALTEDREAERRTDGKGGHFITIPHNVLNTLNYLAALASYSDVIMRWRWPGSGPLFSCVERRNKDRAAESIRVCAQRPSLEVRTCAPRRSLFCGAIETFDALERQLSCSLLTIRVLGLPRELGDLKRCILRSR